MKDDAAVGFIAALFEAEEHLPQRLFEMLLHKKDAMEMVWHHLKGEHFDLGVSDGYLMPVLFYLLSQFGQFDTGLFGVPFIPSLLPTTFPSNGLRPSVAIVIIYICRC